MQRLQFHGMGLFVGVAQRHQCGHSLYVMSHSLLNVAAHVTERELQNFHVTKILTLSKTFQSLLGWVELE